MGIASKKYNDKQWIFPCKGGKMKKNILTYEGLKKYEDETNSFNAEIFNEITVYVYRSDWRI